MAQIWRHCRRVAAALLGLVALAFAPALAEDQGPNDGTDLYDRPVLAIDPGMHTASIWSQAVDAGGRFAVTGGDDRTVRIWSVADGRLLRTIWIPVGPENVGAHLRGGDQPGWIDDRRRRMDRDASRRYIQSTYSIASPETWFGELPAICRTSPTSSRSRRTAATSPPRSAADNGLRVFDRDKNWSEAFRDDQYGDAQLWRGVRARRPSRDDVLRRTDSPLQVRPEQRQPELSPRRSSPFKRAERRSPVWRRLQSGRQTPGGRLRRRRGGRCSRWNDP